MPSRRGVWGLTIGMAVATAIAFPLALRTGNQTFETGVHVPWIVLAVGFFLAELCALHLQYRGNTLTVTPDEVLFVIGLFVLAPTGLVLAYVLGAALMLGCIKRIALFKLAFNIALWSLSSVVAIIVFRTLADGTQPLGVQNWVAAIAATAAAAIISTTAITVAVCLLEGRPSGALRNIGFGLVGTLVDTLLGLGAIVMLAESPLHLILLGGPVAVVLIAYRAYVSESSKSRGLEFLYSASALVSSAADFETGLLALLDFARQTFHADIAEIVLVGGDNAAVPYRTCSGPGEVAAALTPIEGAVADALLTIASDPNRTSPLMKVEGTFLERRAGINIGSALVAPLVHGDDVRGALVIARERHAVVGDFANEEQRLCEAFANFLGTMIEKTRLRASLAQLRVLEQELAHQAYHDSLTGLANRALFHDEVEDVLAKAAELGRSLAVLFIDLDDFKTVNDTMGHAAGDALLTETALRIDACVGASGTAARLGGDEFAVLLPDVAHDMQVRAIAERILLALDEPIDLDGQLVFMHASIGIANQVGVTDAAELMQHADVAMYTAKRNGKGRYDEFQSTMSLTVARRHQVKSGLERALICNEFVLHYQPIIDIKSGEVLGTEALLRWKDPGRGLLPPSEFVGVAEETGLIVPIGRFVLREACRQAAEWATTSPGLRIFVNLSTRQLADPDLLHDVRAALISSGLSAHQLCLEVTETAMMRDIDDARRTLHELKALGVQLAIDDFGTGFSSLSYLRQLPIDLLKIAKPIIDGICDSDEDQAFVRGIIELGHLIGMAVTAEGVERPEQYERLVAMGCDYAQGFYHSRSMEPREAAKHLRSMHVDADVDLESIAVLS